MEFESDIALKEWAKQQPLTILALNPADRAVQRIADERDAIQKKTFTKWVNKHLKKVRRFVNDLFEDLRDGHNLISLLEVLTADNLPREKGIMRFHMLQNIETALDFLHCKKIKIVNIRSEDIVDGNPKLTLGLIWTIILHFQISDVVGHESNVSAREVLLKWAQKTASKYPSVHVNDFTSSWRDGLAFNALVHRNRPDLIDWRTVKSRMTARERLEYVFNVVEKEYGVTRLLDPEDVDTPEPDEKSIITYISSIYDAFPEPPSIHPLYDTKLQQRYYEYRELSQNLTTWMQEKASVMQDYTFPNNIVEMRKVESESARFRNEEVPPKQRDKQRLHHLYKDVVKYFETAGSAIEVEHSLQLQSIENNWNTLMVMYEEREKSLIEETKRLEKCQRLAEKVHREIKYTESRLENLEKRVEDDGRRVDRLHPLEAKQVSDMLEQDITSCEKIIQNLISDVHILKEGHYSQVVDLQKRVQPLHQQWIQIRSLLHSKVLNKLAHIAFPVEERTVTKQTRTVLETRLVDTNAHFRQLQDCIDWCKMRLDKLEQAEYGSDLVSVQRELEHFQNEVISIDQFHGKIENSIRAKSNFHGDELTLYSQYLNQLQKLYSELTSKANNRLSDLDSLVDFIKSATNELTWLNEREEVEISRDWADRNLNCSTIEQYYEHLMNELEKREIQFSAVQDKGETLVLHHHPASKSIEAHMSAMQAQWAWLLQLTLCLEVHLKHAISYQAFYSDIKLAEKWLLERDELLNLEFSQSDFTLDDGEKLLQGMQTLRDELNNFGDTVQNLIQQGQQVVPLKLRRQPVIRSLAVQSICNYKQSNVVIKKGKQCTLLDNSGRIKWKVRNSENDEANVPGVCFVIPPPDKESIDAAEHLRRQYDRTVTLWQKKQLRMRQNMIFATIKVVKSWDLPQFLAIGAEQRNAIRKALNEDAEKLLAEGDPSDPQLRRLRREMDEVNRLFDELERRARAEEESKNAARIFNGQISSLQSILEDAEKLLHQRVMSPIPRNLDALHHSVLEHKEFESRLQILETDIEQIKNTFRNITLKTPNMKKALEKILDKWNNLWTLSNSYTERLKSLEVTINNIEEAHNILSEFEMKLASFEDLPTTETALELVHDKLQSLQSAISQEQIAIDQLNDDFENTKKLIEKSRPIQRPSSNDVDRLANDVLKLNQRWNVICNHLSDRIKCCELAYKHLKDYNKSKDEEEQWLDDTFAKLRNITPVKEQLETVTHVVLDRVPKIDDMNLHGGKLIREGKIFGCCLHKFRDWLLEIHPSLDTSPPFNIRKRKLDANPQIPVDLISVELDAFNLKIDTLFKQLVDSLKQIDEISTTKLVEQLESHQVRTFRTEFKIIDHQPNDNVTNNYNNEDKQITVNGYSNNEFNGESTIDSPSSTKRSRVCENVTTDCITEMPGILHHSTGEVLTVGNAINLRILDVRNGKILASPDGTTVSIDEAVERNLMDRNLAQKLQGSCGIIENGRPVSLLEAIQKELFSNSICDEEQVSISQLNNSWSSSSGKGMIDAHSSQNVYLNQGTIKYHVDIVARNQPIDEIEGFKTESKVTFIEALEKGIINPEIDNRGKLIFSEAKMVYDNNLLDNFGAIHLSQAVDNMKMLNSVIPLQTDIEKMSTLYFQNSRNMPQLLSPINVCNYGLVDIEEGLIFGKDRHLENGLISPAGSTQAVEEKYKLCDEQLAKLLEWISQIEQKLANQTALSEDEAELRNQINIMKQIKDDLFTHTSKVTHCTDQIRQLVLTGGDVLSKSELSNLEKSGRHLKMRFDQSVDRNDRLLKCMYQTLEDLHKFRKELADFATWMDKARRILEDKEQLLSDLSHLNTNYEMVKDFVSDVIAHQADLRFVTMSAQKYFDDSKDFLKSMNEIRTSLPIRLSHLKPMLSQDSKLHSDVSYVTAQYKDLSARTNALSDRMMGVGGRQKEYSDALNKAAKWLKDAEVRCLKVISEPITADPKTIEGQLNNAKHLANEFLNKGRLLDAARNALERLLASLNNQLLPNEAQNLETPIIDLINKYNQLKEALAERCQDLDNALIQSQGVQNSLDNVVDFISDSETKLKQIQKPASLIKEKLEEQIHEHKLYESELDMHHVSVESVSANANQLAVSSSNSKIAKRIETKLKDMRNRYEKLLEKASDRRYFLNEIYALLCDYLKQAQHVTDSFKQIADLIEQISSLDNNKTVIHDVLLKRDSVKHSFDDTVKKGNVLISKRDVTDVANIKNSINLLENQWKALNISFENKQKLIQQRNEHLSNYDKLRDRVVKWLTHMETKVTNLQPVAFQHDILNQQIEELVPIVQEFHDYEAIIKNVEEAGLIYDGLTNNERDRPVSPSRNKPSFASARQSPSSFLRNKVVPANKRSPSPFGSTRDVFHLENMSKTQQQLSDIYNRYNLLGIRLNDRQNELENTKEELRKCVENLKTLRLFLDKIQRQFPKDSSLANTKDDAEKTMQLMKNILEEIYEKQSLLDSTKSQIKDLLKRKPNAKGSENLESELSLTSNQWKQAHQNCKDKIKMLENFKEFCDVYDSLNLWVLSKSRMLTVLGPISSDRRIVQSQVQQVQLLKEEFRVQMPQLQHLLTLGDNIINMCSNTKDAENIRKKLTDIESRWNAILKELDVRASSLGTAADTSREFDDSLNRLKDSLQSISDQLDDIPTNKNPEEQLKKIETLERQLEGLRPLLADAEANGEHLCEVLNDQASKNDIQSKIAAVGKQYINLQKKLDNKKAKIENLLRDGRQFQETCSKTFGWLSDELKSLSDTFLISANREILQQQLDNFEPIYRNITIHEHEVIMLLNKGRDILSKKPEKQLQREVDKIQQNWEKLKKEVGDRHIRLQTCMEHCKKFYSNQDRFMPWLRKAEDTLDSLKPTVFTRKAIEKQLKDLQTFRSEVWRQSGEYETNRMLGETFLSSCDTDKKIVQNELANMKTRWDKFNNDLMKLLQIFEEILSKLIDFNDSIRDLSNQILRFEDRFVSFNNTSQDAKVLNMIESLKTETNALKTPLEQCRKQANELVLEAQNYDINSSHLNDDVNKLGDRINDLQNKLDDRFTELESAVNVVSQFQNNIKQFAQKLSDLETEFENMKPISRDFSSLRFQSDEIDGFLKRASQTFHEINTVIASGAKMGHNFDKLLVEPLQKHYQKIDQIGQNRQNDISNVIERMEKFYTLYSSIMDDVKRVDEKLHNLKPISTEIESIRAQQDDFKKLRKSVIEPLNSSVTECYKLGVNLIQSAVNDVSTVGLERDLDKMQEKWNELKEKLSDRERKLDAGLLQFGKFQEALDGLNKWLTDIEEMVSNQKAPSADYKVVKAQLQEQKFVKKMLSDRQPSMASLFSMGIELADDLNMADRRVIEKQIKDLKTRFNNLSENAQKRTLDLEQAMHVAKQFQDKLLPLEEWLNKTEKKIKDFQQVPTDEDRISEKIQEHEQLHRDILGQKSSFTNLAEIASNLMSLVGEDEAVVLTDKLQEISNRYADLVDFSDNISLILTNSRQGLRHLVLTYQDLVAWMEDIERKLSKYKFLAVFPDKLIEQTENFVQLTENISARQSDIDSTIESGFELMKHISSDEALQLKEKLDNLQRKFRELIDKGVELLRRAQYMLPVVQQFHDKHLIISDWMSEAESLVNNGEINEREIARLEIDITEMRPILETVTNLGPQLCHNASNDGVSIIENLVTKDNRRFDAIVERIQRKAERITLGKQRALEVIGDIDELLEWFREVEQQIRDAEPPSGEPDIIRVQLKEHKALNDDISSQKGRVRDILSTSKKMLRESMSINENSSIIREKMEDLHEMMESVSKLSSDRLSALEQALPLSEHFYDTHNDLKVWLDDIENHITLLSKPALKADIITQQQDKNETFLQSVSEHKPLIDKLNKTGEALVKLCNDDDGAKIQEIVDVDNKRYNCLKLDLKRRQRELEAALQESSQFSDKLEGMLRALSNTAEQVNNLEPISAHPPKIRDQINDNKALIDDLNKRKAAYAAVKKAAKDVLNKTANKSDPAITDMNKKLGQLQKIWEEIEHATNDRSKSLEEALDAAQRFWKQLHSVMAVLKDLQNSIASQEPPASDPKSIQKQQIALQEIRLEIDQTKPDVEKVKATGKQLMSICGDADKPEVKKHIDDLDHAWDNITSLFAKREGNLIDAMEKSMEFYDVLQNLVKFLDEAEKNFAKMGPIGSDIDEVKNQIQQLQKFKIEVDPYMVQIEAINRQAQGLTERKSSNQAQVVKKPLSEVNRRWDSLLHDIIERQQQLENALLRLGQFQHALNELLVWINKTDGNLDDLKPILGDVQTTEIELAKLKVITNDIQAHEHSAESLNIAGKQIIESGDESSETIEKLDLLNKTWDNLLRKSESKHRELEDALRDSQVFQAEIQDLISWLNDVDSVIAASKPVGGLPETANEQLERFMEVFNELEQTGPKVEAVLQQGQEYLRKGSNKSSSNLQQNLKNLKTKWDSVLTRANDKKIKLEIALKEATEFNDTLQAFIDWLTTTEKNITNFKSVSRVMETILLQIENHKVLQKDLSVHRETMLNLDKKGTHLKYFSQKQDVILIKNLLISVQHRWERVVSRVGERTRALDHGYKEAKEFHESWSHLIKWLTETENTLDEFNSETDLGNASNIKLKLSKHQELQRALSAKQVSYDAVMKSGKQLKEKASKTDEPILKEMIQQLKNKWNSVCSKCIDRQRTMEESLLFSGQFSDAIAALLSWLKSMEKELSDNKKVHGDLETVTMLIEEHRSFQKDLKARESQYASVIETGEEMESKINSTEFIDTHGHLVTIKQLWSSVSQLEKSKNEKLEDALRDAESLHKSVHMLLDWLSEAEQRLRFVNSLPDDELEASNLQNELDKFLFELDEKEHIKNETIELAQQILEKAHPNAVTVIKNWIKVIQTRWEEISSWAHQKEEKLQSHMKSLHDLDEVLEELLKWLLNLESTLTDLKKEPLPDSVPSLESLIDDHREFMENTMKRQSEVNNICKSKQIKSTTKDLKKKSRLRTPLRSSQIDLHRDSSPQVNNATLNRKQKQETKFNEFSCDPYPHIGPRFTSTESEPEFKTARVKLLWSRWRNVWVLAWERQKALYRKLEYLREVERVKNFSWDEWRKRFLKFMNHKKSRLTDLFRKMDKDNNGLIPREDFIDGIIKTKFETSRLEMNAVADLFDRNNSGLIDWEEFIAALRPDWVERKDTDAEKIHDEVKRLVMLCTCRQKFKVFQVGEGKYRFGESQKLRLVRILRSTVMVRVGGGWVALDEFLIKNDPCRVALVYPLPNPKKPEEHDVWCPFAKGRTNIELREQFILADGVSQCMTAFRPRTSQSPRTTTPAASGPITKIRERSQRSQPMSSSGNRTRSSASAGTPDSLSDNENGLFKTWRRTPLSNRVTPCASRSNSRPNSRPPSRAGSKPPSRYGSANSLDSIDTPSRIPRKSSIPSTRSKNLNENGNILNRRPSLTSPSCIPRSTPTTKQLKKQTVTNGQTENGRKSPFKL